MECVVLAGGKGTRLKSVVADLPKCMAEVAGKPFLSYIISSLENVGFHHIILSLGFMHEVVEEWVASLECRARITCVVENVPLGTGGGCLLYTSTPISWMDLLMRVKLSRDVLSGRKIVIL